MNNSTMEVMANGNKERREIAYRLTECDMIGGDASRMPRPYPVHMDNEMVVQTVSGETFVIKA